MKKLPVVLFTISVCLFVQCRRLPAKVIVLLQPFNGYPAGQAQTVANGLTKTYRFTVITAKNIALPANAYYQEQNRYSADTLINFLTSRKADTIFTVIGLTDRDIFTAKGNNPHWGVMGLGTLGADAAVVSTSRLHHGPMENKELLMLAAHELGHNLGLPHCPNKTCIMADAEGHSNFYRETGFCAACRKRLLDMGVMVE